MCDLDEKTNGSVKQTANVTNYKRAPIKDEVKMGWLAETNEHLRTAVGAHVC